MSSGLAQRLDGVRKEIAAAAIRSQRAAIDITLVCVSKTFPVEIMNEAAESLVSRGLPVIFGENYLQEYEGKKPLIKVPHIAHCIGHLQSNKVAKAVALFDVIESVHSEKVLALIEKEALKIGKVMPLFIQVNISADPQKSGFATADLERIFSEVLPDCRAVEVLGLMAITELYDNREDARKDFRALKKIGEVLSRQCGKTLALSMGMSADYDIAIEEGATHVRVGSALFGSRNS